MSVPTDKVSPSGASSEPEQSPSGSEERPEGAWQATVIRDILIGQRIGEYVVRRRIGTGGMGVVYEGEHPVIGRKVAIKIIRSDNGDGGRARDLVAEARATSSIRHRGIIDIFGFGTLPGIGQYLVMELLSGQPLNEVMRDRLPLPLPEAVRLVIEILGALSAAHGVGVIHRDLKPGNIFLVRESNGAEYVKVLDFGLAKQAAAPHSATPQTRTSIVVGTPEYMAPEQACGQPVSPSTDLYSVGTLLFEMVTGQLPFKGDSPMHVAIQQVHSPPPAPSSIVKGLPPELEALILRMLAKAPDQRPLSAEAVSQELQWIAGRLGAPLSGAGVAPPFVTGRLVIPAGLSSSEAVTEDADGSRPTLTSGSVPVRKPARVPPPPAPPPPESLRPTDSLLAVRRAAQGRLWVGAGVAMLLVGGGVFWSLRSAPVVPAPAPLETPEPVAAPEPVAVPEPVAAPEPVVQAVPVTPPAPEPARIDPAPQPPPPTVPHPAAMGPGTVLLSVKCFANLYIDGALRGQAHKGAIPLSPGTHVLELRDNPVLKDHRVQLVIRPGQKYSVQAPCQRLE